MVANVKTTNTNPAKEIARVPSVPVKGQSVTVRGLVCTITRVYPFGTIDVVSVDGNHAYRLTGLGYVRAY